MAVFLYWMKKKEKSIIRTCNSFPIAWQCYCVRRWYKTKYDGLQSRNACMNFLCKIWIFAYLCLVITTMFHFCAPFLMLFNLMNARHGILNFNCLLPFCLCIVSRNGSKIERERVREWYVQNFFGTEFFEWCMCAPIENE